MFNKYFGFVAEYTTHNHNSSKRFDITAGEWCTFGFFYGRSYWKVF